MNKDMRMMREINIQAIAFYEAAVKLGDHAAFAFRDLNRSKKNSHRSQMTGLENIAESTFKVADILDYIKKQIARFDYWRKGYPRNADPNEGFGEALKKYLENDMKEKCDTICRRLEIKDSTDDDKYKRQQVYLQLIRQFIRQMVVEYEYRISKEENGNGTNTGASA